MDDGVNLCRPLCLSYGGVGGVQVFRPYSKEMVVCVGWGGEGWDYESKSVHPSSPQQVVDSPSLMRVYG